MKRGITTAYEDAVRADPTKPVYLVSIATDLSAPDDVLRITNFSSDVLFPDPGGDTYEAVPHRADDFQIDMDGGKGGDLAIADVDGLSLHANKTWRDLIILGANFQFQKVDVFAAQRSELGDALDIQSDSFMIADWGRPHGEMVFALKPLMAWLDVVELPPETVTKEEYPGIPLV